jgi:hypothetical protein
VTSQYRKEGLQDTPISESAMSGEELARRNVTDLSSLAGTVPGFLIGAANATQRHESMGCISRGPERAFLVLTTSSASRF